MEIWTIPGTSDYRRIYQLQKELVEKRIEGAIGDTILLVEHLPVITRGRGLQKGSSEIQLKSGHPKVVDFDPKRLPESMDYCEVERGGDFTYHGPGQLVIYPIFKLATAEDPSTPGGALTLNSYLRSLETILIGLLGRVGVEGFGIPNATGVWVRDRLGLERKIASIGIAVRQGVTFHGAAINVVNDLKPFGFISPCGFSSEIMTSLQEQEALLSPDWREPLEKLLFQEMQLRWNRNLHPVVQARV